MSLPHVVVDWAAVFKFCGISWSYLYIFEINYTRLFFFLLLFYLPNYHNHYSFTLDMVYFYLPLLSYTYKNTLLYTIITQATL